MKPERWQQIDQILDGALQREGSQPEESLSRRGLFWGRLAAPRSRESTRGQRAEGFIEALALEEGSVPMLRRSASKTDTVFCRPSFNPAMTTSPFSGADVV